MSISPTKDSVQLFESETIIQRNRMRESCSYGSVGVGAGNGSHYPEIPLKINRQMNKKRSKKNLAKRSHVAPCKARKAGTCSV